MSKLLSLVIPCYNESKNLPALLNRIGQIHPEAPLEFLLVNNGSRDQTEEIFSRLSSPLIKTATVPLNQGYGHGIYEGLKQLTTRWVGWTHADLQTDPLDALKILEHLQREATEDQFLKGIRFGRPLFDRFFTGGMALFESCLFRTALIDINAQPTVFPRTFFQTWSSPPKDFSLDLYAYLQAKRAKLKEVRIPVFFQKRLFGVSHWNYSFSSKARFIRRTIKYSFELLKQSS